MSRKNVGNALLSSSCTEHVFAKIADGQPVHDASVLRKAKSEVALEDRKDRQAEVDLLLQYFEMEDQEKSFLAHYVVKPFEVHLYGKESFNFMKILKKTTTVVLHIDATGGVVRKNKMFYYAGKQRQNSS